MPLRLTMLATLTSALLAVTPSATSVASGGPAACSAAHIAVKAATVPQAGDATLCLLNRARARAGLPPLHINHKLASVAQRHSREMVKRRYFGHDSPDGATPFERILATHYVPPSAHAWWLGENIGWGSVTLAQPAAIVHAWMRSPPHRANILSSHFREIGIGIAPAVPVQGERASGATYTTDFGSHR